MDDQRILLLWPSGPVLGWLRQGLAPGASGTPSHLAAHTDSSLELYLLYSKVDIIYSLKSKSSLVYTYNKSKCYTNELKELWERVIEKGEIQVLRRAIPLTISLEVAEHGNMERLTLSLPSVGYHMTNTKMLLQGMESVMIRSGILVDPVPIFSGHPSPLSQLLRRIISLPPLKGKNRRHDYKLFHKKF